MFKKLKIIDFFGFPEIYQTAQILINFFKNE